MYKQLLHIVLALVLLASTLGCVPGVTSNITPGVTPSKPDTVPTTAIDGSTIPDDFYFIYEIGRRWHGVALSPDNVLPLLDTINNILGTERLYEDGYFGYFSMEYHMPQSRLRALYNDIIKYDLRLYSSPDLLSDHNDSSEVHFYCRLTFQINDEIYTITFDDSVLKETAPEELWNLQAFCAILMQNDYVFDDVPDDFYFVYEFGDPLTGTADFRSLPLDPRLMRPLLDTKNNTLGTCYANYVDAFTGHPYKGYACIEYFIPPEHLKAIYNYLVLYDIKSYSGSEVITGVHGMNLESTVWLRYIFQMNGEVYSVQFDGTVLNGPNFWYSKIWEFARILDGFYYYTDVLQSLENNPPDPPVLDLPPKQLPRDENHSDLETIMLRNSCFACHYNKNYHCPYPKAPTWIGSYPAALGPWTIPTGSEADHTGRFDSTGCLIDGCHAKNW